MSENTATPRVSVIMNCLDGEKHLASAMDSVMNQSFQDFEIVFWDNCSTDSSPEIAKSYKDKVRYFRGEKKVPLGAGRNLAIAQARGEFIAFLDCDDLWEPTKLAKQIALFDKNPRLGLVTTDTEVFSGDKVMRRVFEGARPARGMVFSELIKRQWISMSSAIVRRKTLEDLVPGTGWSGGWFDEELNVSEEADVFYRIAHDWELDYVDEPLTRWRVHGQNTTLRRFGEFARETRIILEKHRKLYPNYDIEHADLCELLQTRADFEEAVSLWQKGDGARARSLLAPYGKKNRKIVAFRLLSYLPGSLFDVAASIYYRLPKLFS